MKVNVKEFYSREQLRAIQFVFPQMQSTDEKIQNVTISFVRSVAPKLLGNYPKNSAISVIDPSINPTMTN